MFCAKAGQYDVNHFCVGVAVILFRGAMLQLLVLLLLLTSATAWVSFDFNDTRQWCKQVESPIWPYAYSRIASVSNEVKVPYYHILVTRHEQYHCCFLASPIPTGTHSSSHDCGLL